MLAAHDDYVVKIVMELQNRVDEAVLTAMDRLFCAGVEMSRIYRGREVKNGLELIFIIVDHSVVWELRVEFSRVLISRMITVSLLEKWSGDFAWMQTSHTPPSSK